MSHEEKGVWVYLLSSAGSYAVYLAIVIDRAMRGPITHVSYVPVLLLAAVVSVAISIPARIAFDMARPSESRQRDVRDRDIARFGEHASRWFVIGGAGAGLAMAMVRWDYFWIANVIYLGFVLWAVAGSVIRLVAYRRGI